MKTLLLILLLTLSIACSVNAQDGWHTADGQRAADLFENEVSPPFGAAASLSPDGAFLAATSDAGICILTLATGEEECFAFPETFSGGLPARLRFNPLVWSPDSSQIVFTEEVFYSSLESDLWLLNVGSGGMSNLTDDSVEGSWIDSASTDFSLDYLPAFAPNGDIYFFRSERIRDTGSGILDYSLVLQRLADGENTPEQIADLTELPSRPNRGTAVSPDGTQFVFDTLNSERAPELWLVDLASSEVRQLTNADAMYAGMPEAVQPGTMFLYHPVWAGDSRAVIFESYSAGMGAPEPLVFPFINYLYVDIETGDVTPLVDLTDFPVIRTVFESSADPDAEWMRIPRDGAVSADSNSFVYLRHGGDSTDAELVVVPLPPGTGEPVIISEVDYSAPTPNVFMPNPQMSADGKALLGGWLYTFGQ